MDESNTNKRSNTNLNQKSISKEKLKRNLNVRAKRDENSSVGQTVSCTELTSSCLKTFSHSNLESNSMFFNEKGWPVKVMRVTETSPPKAIKPWPTRSLPSTSVSSIPTVRKDKSIYTQTKKTTTKIYKEDKENRTKATKESGPTANELMHQPVEQDQENKIVVVDEHKTDLKSMLDNLDETLNNISSENVNNHDNGKKMSVKGSDTKKSTQKLTKKPPSPEKSENLYSARSNKYKSEEMRAYIQTKRSQRKLQLSEEVKKKQAVMEMQRKNLEKLKEKASKVLKKSSNKTIEENKPRWQGPLEDDNSDTSVLAIHIFGSKIPTAKKSKLSIKPESAELLEQSEKKEVNNELAMNEGVKDDNTNVDQEVHVEKLFNNETNSLKMGKENKEKSRESSISTKLRLSRNKLSMDDPRLVLAMEKAASEHGTEWKTDLDNIKENIDQSTQPSKLSNGWNNNQIALTEFNTLQPAVSNDDRRATFDVSHHSKEESLVPVENSFRKRHHDYPLTYNDISSKKMCDKESAQLPCDPPVPEQSIEDALKKVQEQIISNQKKGKDPEWLHTFIKPDGFSMMNVIKMKRLSHQKKQNSESEKSGQLQKVIAARRSIEDETDATSITSMDDDFKVIPEPLRLSEICLPVSKTISSSTADFTPQSSQDLKKMTDDSLKTAASSFASQAPPLVVPEYVQHLKLKSRRTPSELTSSMSLELPCQTLSELPTSDRPSMEKQLQPSPVQLSSSNTGSYKKGSSQQAEHMKFESQSKMSDGQVEIGQVLSSAALLLQFHAELNRLDAFDQSLAQVIAAERLYHTPSGRCRQTRVVSAEPDSSSTSVRSMPVRRDHYTSTSELATQQNQVSVPTSSLSLGSIVTNKGNSTQSISEQLISPDSASDLGRHSSLQSIEELNSNQEMVNDKSKEVFQIQRPVSSSQMTTPPSTSSNKNLQLFKMLIEDAVFQKEQYDLMYRTQEDVLQANYKAALADLELKVRNIPSSLDSGPPDKEIEVRNKIEACYRRARSNIRRTKTHVISNWMKRIDDLHKEKEQLEKQIKNKRYKLRSAEDSPKKLVALRSTSASSIVDNSSSSESSVTTQHFDDKKRHENGKTFVLNRKKVEKEILKKLFEEEKQKVQEIEKVERSLRSGRSRRDKSTSPLHTVEETSTRDVACSVHEDIQTNSHQLTSSILQSVEEARGTDVYNSESFESPESSETPRQPRLINRPFSASKPFITARFNSKSKMLIKVPLSPRMQWCTKRRGSSGSDESILFSQNDTQSEQSDYEVKISALKEQKRQRLTILNRLHRELKKAQKELLKATETSLIKQIQVYDSYIDQTMKQLAEVTEEVYAKKIVKPQIKHPRVSDKFLPRVSDSFPQTPVIESDTKQLEVTASDIETNSIKTVSEVSSTETTIHSSGQTQIAEQLPPNVEVNNEEISNNVLQIGGRVSESLSSVTTDASNAPVEISASPVISEIIEDKSKSTISNTESVEDDSQWVDAEEFFSQLEHVDKVQTDNSQHSKVGVRDVPTSHSTNGSKSVISILSSISTENLAGQNYTESKETTVFQNSEPIIDEHVFPDSSTNDLVVVEEKVSIEKLTDSRSDQIDVGSIVSIISQTPSLQKPISSNSEVLDSFDCEPNSIIISTESDPKSDFDHFSENESCKTTSIANSEKSNIQETAFLNNSLDASVSSDINATSQYSTSCISDGDGVIGPSESSVIKVFVSNKTHVIDKDTVEDNNSNLNELDKTFIVSEDKVNKKDINLEVDTITDYLLNKLLGECLEEKQTKKVMIDKDIDCHSSNVVTSTDKITNLSKNENSVNDFTNTVLNKFLKDATDCMLKINESKKLMQFNLNSVSNKTEDKSSPNKLLDALALESSVFLDKGHGDGLVEPENNISEVELADGNEGEIFWFDEDLRPVSLQAQREAEELRIKQLQIEQEIKQLELAQENIPSYYYVREIPNKPPPPYTPPQPTKQEDIEGLATVAAQNLVAAWKRGDNLTFMQPSEQYISKRVGSHVFKKFMFDLVKQILVDITSNEGSEKDCPPWEKTGYKLRHMILPELTEESVKSFVLRRVRVLFGFEPNFIKENLIIQWSRKKRDRVDELLVRESQEEEQEWTDYSKYEVAVKNSVALNIFDSLLEETTTAVNNAFEKKLTYSQQSS